MQAEMVGDTWIEHVTPAVLRQCSTAELITLCSQALAVTAAHYRTAFSAFSYRWQLAPNGFAPAGLVDLRQHLGMRLLLLRIGVQHRQPQGMQVDGQQRQVSGASLPLLLH